jgi:formate dehydrogenase (coenzyme F420) beta subunit
MKQQVIDRVKELLREGKIQGFLGLREFSGHVQPYLFTNPDDLADLSIGDKAKAGEARYPLDKVLTRIARVHPEAYLGILVRGCDERGLNELYKWNQLDESHVVKVGIACPVELALACECLKPFPDDFVAGEKVDGVSKSRKVENIDGMTVGDRFGHWMEQFDKCVKCYGCRNVCPICFCNECTLEEPELIQKAVLPTENPIFHLTRAVHMIGRCIDCGLCEEACPADIPLRTLYRKVADIVEADTGFRPGMSRDEKCPFNLIATG